MNVRNLIKHLLDCDPDAEVMAVNVNDAEDVENNIADEGDYITGASDADEGFAAIYFVGDATKPPEEE